MYRIACDTGVVFSGLFFGGKPGAIIELAKQDEGILFLSDYVRDELYLVTGAKGRQTRLIDAFLSLGNVRVVAREAYDKRENFIQAKRYVRDRKDWPVYAFFLEMLQRGQADYFISSDSDLLEIGKESPLYGKILSPAQFLEQIR